MFETLLAMDGLTIATFLGAGILLNLTPGADVLFATASGMAGGWRAGIAAAVGIGLGSLAHVALAVVGVSAVIIALPYGYDILRYAGAAYLLVLAWQSWHARPEAAARGRAQLWPALRRGFLTNLLNPKVALFIMALLPQFTAPEAGPIWQQMLWLGLIFTATGLIITSGYGALAGLFGGALRTRMRLMNRLSSLIFGGLAARLAFN
ncbi:LysE family translocator [Abyssibius alkaniclasticus]|uniref:LysE family translocator n=1 Tax=Abyssibius alkaniclasticus TaxID=2881234 RepID=UPI0040581715|tara:strand:+ start:738 stop:1358 length:621 start_codon:yes stop_codon:yes gene_type:complete